MKRVYLLTLFLLLSGCGGGGSSDEADTPASSSTPQPPPPVVKTKDLVSNTTFDFNSNYQLSVVLPAKPKDANDYFVNVCTKYNETAPVIDDYSSCKVRGYLSDSNQTIELDLSESERVLIAQIWPMYPESVVRTYYFESTKDNQTWKLVF